MDVTSGVWPHDMLLVLLLHASQPVRRRAGQAQEGSPWRSLQLVGASRVQKHPLPASQQTKALTPELEEGV